MVVGAVIIAPFVEEFLKAMGLMRAGVKEEVDEVEDGGNVTPYGGEWRGTECEPGGMSSVARPGLAAPEPRSSQGGT